jgi:hypothetical protein
MMAGRNANIVVDLTADVSLAQAIAEIKNDTGLSQPRRGEV